MRVVITGSQYWEDSVRVSQLIHLARYRSAQRGEPFVIGFGDCPTGAEAMAWECCRFVGVPYQRFEAKRLLLGNEAWLQRNRLMIDTIEPDYVLAFFCDPLKGGSRGTHHCADYAESKGIRVFRFKEGEPYEHVDSTTLGTS